MQCGWEWSHGTWAFTNCGNHILLLGIQIFGADRFMAYALITLEITIFPNWAVNKSPLLTRSLVINSTCQKRTGGDSIQFESQSSPGLHYLTVLWSVAPGHLITFYTNTSPNINHIVGAPEALPMLRAFFLRPWLCVVYTEVLHNRFSFTFLARGYTPGSTVDVRVCLAS